MTPEQVQAALKTIRRRMHRFIEVACQFCCKIAVISSAKNRLAVNEITASYFLARYDN
jgi:phage gp36-like protein